VSARLDRALLRCRYEHTLPKVVEHMHHSCAVMCAQKNPTPPVTNNIAIEVRNYSPCDETNYFPVDTHVTSLNVLVETTVMGSNPTLSLVDPNGVCKHARAVHTRRQRCATDKNHPQRHAITRISVSSHHFRHVWGGVPRAQCMCVHGVGACAHTHVSAHSCTGRERNAHRLRLYNIKEQRFSVGRSPTVC
jgi:hypothetical protein